MILITGASGKTGRSILRALASQAEPVRALVHHAEQASEAIALGAGESVVGDLQDPATLQKAFEGVRVVYHICPNMHPAEVEIARQVLAEASSAGVERFVYHSVLHPQAEEMPHHWNKMRAEELIFRSGIPFTICQPAVYMQNILGYWSKIMQGHYPVPYAPESRLSLVDLEDIGAAVARILTEAGHENVVYELCGPDSPNQLEIARALSLELGIDVQAERISLEAWEKQAKSAGLPEYMRETLIKMFVYYERYGLKGNTQVLTWLLKKRPTSLNEFLRRSVQEQNRE